MRLWLVVAVLMALGVMTVGSQALTPEGCRVEVLIPFGATMEGRFTCAALSPSATPTLTPTRPPTVTPTVTPLPTATYTPTPTITPTATPLSTATPTPAPVPPTSTPEPSPVATPEPTSTPTPANTPTPGPVSMASRYRIINNNRNGLTTPIPILVEHRFMDQALQPVGPVYWIIVGPGWQEFTLDTFPEIPRGFRGDLILSSMYPFAAEVLTTPTPLP